MQKLPMRRLRPGRVGTQWKTAMMQLPFCFPPAGEEPSPGDMPRRRIKGLWREGGGEMEREREKEGKGKREGRGTEREGEKRRERERERGRERRQRSREYERY